VATHAAEALKLEYLTSNRPKPVASTVGSLDRSKGGESKMTFTDWFEFVRTNWRKQEGQTMAEYGVVLAVITLLIVGTLTALSGGINNALNNVVKVL
jgi:Flp pilus assembly pilin Flp